MRPDLGLVVAAALVSVLVSVAQGVGAPVEVTRESNHFTAIAPT